MKVIIEIEDLVDLCRAFQTNTGDEADEAYIRMWLTKNQSEYGKILTDLAEEVKSCRREIDKLWRKIR